MILNAVKVMYLLLVIVFFCGLSHENCIVASSYAVHIIVCVLCNCVYVILKAVKCQVSSLNSHFGKYKEFKRL